MNSGKQTDKQTDRETDREKATNIDSAAVKTTAVAVAAAMVDNFSQLNPSLNLSQEWCQSAVLDA